MNTYLDTRGLISNSPTFTDVIVKGIAPGGGLYVPCHIPHFTIDGIVAFAEKPYAQRAAAIYRAFEVDLGDEDVDAIMAGSYAENFDDPAIAPIRHIAEGMHVMELWHGPTSAFKDMALQCLPRCFSAAVEKQASQTGMVKDYLVLVATSGDTGKAALAGFADRAHTRIAVFYPDGGVSEIQRKQMLTQRGENVQVFAARGNFDDCQTSIKQAFNDEAFNTRLADDEGLLLSSANSINWGRLMPQVVYYVSAYAEMVASGAVASGDPIDVCVPTGNFGNILGAYYARAVGTPIGRLICASNENRVLTDFIDTGTYDIVDRPFVLTPSPSMDILVSSNVERQLFELTGRDGERIRSWMKALHDDRRFQIDSETFGKLQGLFSADSVSNAECLETIREVHDEYGYLIDPHTAVAWRVAERQKSDNPVLIVSTAHWAKFGADVYRALHGIAPGQALPDGISQLSGAQLNERVAHDTDSSIPLGLAEVDRLPLRFSGVVDGDVASVESAITEWLSSSR